MDFVSSDRADDTPFVIYKKIGMAQLELGVW